MKAPEGEEKPFDQVLEGGGSERDHLALGLLLLLRQGRPKLLLGNGEGFFDDFFWDGGAVAAVQLAAEGLGHSGLPGEHRGERVHRLPCTDDADERHHFWAGERPVDQSVEDFWGLAVEVWGQGDDHVPA